MSGITIKRLPRSKTTQDMFDTAKEMRKNMDSAFKDQFRGSISPQQEQIMLHEQQVKENMRGIMALLYKAVAVECPGVLISFTDDELKARAISPEEFFIQPVDKDFTDV